MVPWCTMEQIRIWYRQNLEGRPLGLTQGPSREVADKLLTWIKHMLRKMRGDVRSDQCRRDSAPIAWSEEHVAWRMASPRWPRQWQRQPR